MKKIGFSGTLDPITNGHMWVIGEARSLAEQVVVFLSENPFKQPCFPVEQRKAIIEASAVQRGWHNVDVVIVRRDYTARAAKSHGVDYLIRGIRNTADFDYENLIQQTNVDVLRGAKTLFVMPPRDLGSVSSSFVKALQGPVGWHWKMKQFIPDPAYVAWIVDWLRKQWNALWPDQLDEADRQFAHLSGTACYGAAGRHYHNLEHLVHGLTEIEVWAANTGADPTDVASVKKAFWFHDAVYDPLRHGISNEEQSALLWLNSGLEQGDSGRVADLIRATDHFQASAITHPLKDVMLGADLAILGQDEAVYDAYAQAIRTEYSHVPELIYRQQRCKALMHLQQNAQAGELYRDPYFAHQYNHSANANLAREIAVLSTG